MKISINTPCHENWDTMLPDEKGAFCLSCQKSVVDFSDKSLNQIKDFFRKKKDPGSVCGRFEETQLTALSFDDFFSDFVNWKFIRKVALIVFFVFGLSLFSNAQTKPMPRPKPKVIAPEPMVMGAIAYVPQDTVKKACVKDTVKYDNFKTGEVEYIPEKQQAPKRMGKVAAPRPSKK